MPLRLTTLTSSVPSHLPRSVCCSFIDGAWVDGMSGAKFKAFDPRTGAEIATVHEAGASDLDVAVVAATKGLATLVRVSHCQCQCRCHPLPLPLVHWSTVHTFALPTLLLLCVTLSHCHCHCHWSTVPTTLTMCMTLPPPQHTLTTLYVCVSITGRYETTGKVKVVDRPCRLGG